MMKAKLSGASTLAERLQGRVLQCHISWKALVPSGLRKYGYLLDKAKKATETVVAQAELLGEEWASEK